MKPEDKAVVQQALEALEYHTVQTRPLTRTQEAMDALRQLLEQPVQEPVEMREVLVKIARFLGVVRVYAQDIQPKNELETDKPLHWKARELQDEVIRLLDTTPQAQPAPVQEPWCMAMNRCDSKCQDCPDKVDQPAQPAPVQEHELALYEATQIATWLWKNFYKDTAPQWEVLPDIRGVLSQIDNMVAGLKYDPPAQPAEPEAWMRPNKWTLLLVGDNHGLVGKFGCRFAGHPEHYERVDVYAAAPAGDSLSPTDAQPAAWVGLTDEERRKLFDPLHDAPFEFAKRIEAKLKEKNT
jgi:hypothetical protein